MATAQAAQVLTADSVDARTRVIHERYGVLPLAIMRMPRFSMGVSIRKAVVGLIHNFCAQPCEQERSTPCWRVPQVPCSRFALSPSRCNALHLLLKNDRDFGIPFRDDITPCFRGRTSLCTPDAVKRRCICYPFRGLALPAAAKTQTTARGRVSTDLIPFRSFNEIQS